MRSLLKILLYLILALIIITVGLVIAIRSYGFQNKVVKQATEWFSEKTETSLTVDRVEIDFFTRLNLKGVLLLEPNGDTIAHIGRLQLHALDLLKPDRVIEDIKLDQVYAYIHRDAEKGDYNIDRIIRALASPEPKEPKDKAPFTLNLKNVKLSKIKASIIDDWSGQDQIVTLEEATVKIDSLDLIKNRYIVKDVQLDQPNFLLRYKNKSPNYLKAEPKSKLDSTKTKPHLEVANLNMRQGGFRLFRVGSVPPSTMKFDPNDIDLRDIYIDADDVHTTQGTIRGWVRKLAARDKSGIAITNLQTDLTLSNSHTYFDKMSIALNQSQLKGQIHFIYNNLRNLSYFLDSVVIDARLQNSRIATNDVAYFTDALAPWNILAQTNLDFKGPVSDFTADVSNLQTERGSAFAGKVSIKGIPDMEHTLLDVQVDKAVTNLNALSQIVPQLREIEEVDFDALGTVTFVGGFRGRYLDFSVQGRASTARGEIDINRFDYDMMREGEPLYSGDLDFHNINLSGFIPDLPKVEGKGHVDFQASGIDPDRLYIDLQSKLEHVYYEGAKYNDLTIDGRATSRGLKAKVNSGDANLLGDFDLLFDMTRDYHIVVDGDFKNVDLQALGVSADPFTLRGLMDIDMQGDFNTVMNGYARLSDAVVKYKDSTVREDFIKLDATTISDSTSYVFTTPFLRTALHGKFALDQLPDLVRSTIYRYLPGFFGDHRYPFRSSQYVAFDMQGGGFQKYIDLFIPELKLSDHINLQARLSSESVLIGGSIPSLQYSTYIFDSLVLDIVGDSDELDNHIYASEFDNGQDTLLKHITMQTLMADNNIDLLLKTEDNNSNLNILQSNLLADNDTFKFQLLPSDIFINNRKWHLESEGLSYYHKEYLNVATTKIDNSIGRFVVKSISDPAEYNPSLMVTLEEFGLENLLDFVEGDLPDMQSTVTGQLLLQDPVGDMRLTNNLNFADFKIDQRPLGDINLDATYADATQRVDVLQTSGIAYDDTYIKVAGDVLLDSTQRLNLEMRASDYDISPFGAFIDDILQNLEGRLSGSLNIGGTIDEYDITGDLNLKKTKFRIPMMGNTYRIPSTHLTFNNTLFETDTTTLYDEDDNIARLYGLIGHTDFNDYQFSIDFWSDKFRVLNTTAEESPEVYGNVVARLNALIFGSLKDLVFGLSIEPVQLSEITAVNVASDKSGGLDGIDFRGISDFADTSDIEEDDSRVKLELSARVSPLLRANYIISQVDNSSLTVRGDGDVTINYTLGSDAEDFPMTAYGGFVITDGVINYLNSANFELSQIAGVKIFDIIPGSKVVINGDPMRSRVTGGANTTIEVNSLEGMFTAEELDEISRTSPAAKNDIYRSQDVLVGVKVDNATIDELQNIKYTISLPEVTSNNAELNARLASINSDQNEASKQVMSLLILNSFLSQDNMSTRLVFNSALGNTANIFTSRISSSLNQTIKNVTNFDNLDVGLGLKFENDSSSLLNQQSLIPVVNFNGKVRLLDNRLVLKVGYDLNMANYSSSSFLGSDQVITGDYKLEYRLDKGRNLDAYVYRNSSYDPLLSSKGKINRSGVGLSYSFSFQKFGEIFARKEEEEKTESDKQ